MAHKIDWTTYSTSTEVTTGEWVDGKTIYRKTFRTTFTVTAGTQYSGQLNVTPDSGTISQIIRVEIRVDGSYSSAPNDTVDYGNFYSASDNNIRVFSRYNTLQIRANDSVTRTKELYATVYYTKTS